MDYKTYTPKPALFKAVQWFKNGDHPDDYKESVTGLKSGNTKVYSPEFQKENDWEGQVVRRFRHPDFDGELHCITCKKAMKDHGWLERRNVVVCPGSYVTAENNTVYVSYNKKFFEENFTLAE